MTLRQFYYGNLIKLMRRLGWVPKRKYEMLEESIKGNVYIRANSLMLVIPPSGKKIHLQNGETASITTKPPESGQRWVVRIMEENQ